MVAFKRSRHNLAKMSAGFVISSVVKVILKACSCYRLSRVMAMGLVTLDSHSYCVAGDNTPSNTFLILTLQSIS